MEREVPDRSIEVPSVLVDLIINELKYSVNELVDEGTLSGGVTVNKVMARIRKAADTDPRPRIEVMFSEHMGDIEEVVSRHIPKRSVPKLKSVLKREEKWREGIERISEEFSIKTSPD